MEKLLFTADWELAIDCESGGGVEVGVGAHLSRLPQDPSLLHKDAYCWSLPSLYSAYVGPWYS